MALQVQRAAEMLELVNVERSDHAALLHEVSAALGLRNSLPSGGPATPAPPVVQAAQDVTDRCVDLPHGNREWWERVQQAWQEPVQGFADFEDRLHNLHGERIDASGLRALEILYGGEFSEATFFESTLPHVVALALALPEACPGPIPVLEQRSVGVVDLSRRAVASLLANMFLCNFKPPQGGLQYRQSHMPRGDFSSLLGQSQESTVAKLRMFIHYFERLKSANNGEPRGNLRIRRNVVNAPPTWRGSAVPLRAFSTKASGVEDSGGCLQVDFANEFIGGGVLGSGSVQEEIKFAVCPELCVSMLICQSMLAETDEDGVSEAIVLTGAEQFSAYEGYGRALRYGGDFIDSSARTEDGSFQTSLTAIDAARFTDQSIDHQFREHMLGRELGKAYAGFKDTGDGTEASLERFSAVATGNWGCGVFGGFAPLKAVLQWMAASEANRDLVYHPFDNHDLDESLQRLVDAVREAGDFVTVGWMYRALVRFGTQDNRGQGVDAGELLSFLIYAMEAESNARKQDERMRQRSWTGLATRSREYSLDIVPRLAFCRGPLVDLIVESGLHRYSEFISVQGSYLFVDGALHRVPCSKSEVFKDKFIGMKEKRLLMKFMQTVLSYEPPAAKSDAAAVRTLASKSGGLQTNEAEVLRQHAAGVRRPEAITAATTAAESAATSELDEWLNRPFVEFLEHRQLTETLIIFILYALALEDRAPTKDGNGVTTEQGLASLQRYMSCLGRFADTHTAFISTMYGAGEIPQSFCRCCAVYGGVYVLRRTMKQLLVGAAPPLSEPELWTEPETEPGAPLDSQVCEDQSVPVPAPSLSQSKVRGDDGTEYFNGIVCTAGQRLTGQYLVSGWEHLSALRPDFEEGDQVEVYARAVCITTSSLVDEMGTILSVMPPNSLLPGAANDCCVRLQQYDRNARVGPAGEFVVHISCSATVVAESHEAIAGRQLELQGFLKAAVRLLFDTKSCCEVVDNAGRVSSAPAPAPAASIPAKSDDESGNSKPELVWSLFFNKTVRATKSSNLPANVFVAEETHWGDLDFDGATLQAQQIFEQMFPGEPFLPPLPDPESVQDDVALLLVRSTPSICRYSVSSAKLCCSNCSNAMVGISRVTERRRHRARASILRTVKSASHSMHRD